MQSFAWAGRLEYDVRRAVRSIAGRPVAQYPPNNFYCGVANANMAKCSRISERDYLLYRSGIRLAQPSGYIRGLRGCYLYYGGLQTKFPKFAVISAVRPKCTENLAKMSGVVAVLP